MTTFTGRDGVQTFVAITLKHGLILYHRTGMKPNRNWTPTAMLREASRITGKKFKRGEYIRAATCLQTWIDFHGTRGENP